MYWHDSQFPIFIYLSLPPLLSTDCLQEGLKGDPVTVPPAQRHGEPQPRQEGSGLSQRPGLQEETPRVHRAA